MKSILKKSIKVSFVAIAALKINDHMHSNNGSNYFNEQCKLTRRAFIEKAQAKCDDEQQSTQVDVVQE